MTSLDEIPRVCFIDDLARAMRTSTASLKLQHKCGFAYFPALPTIDRRVRYSGEFVRWFLTENPYWVRRFRELLENAKKASRQRRRQWYEFGPPHTQPFIAAPRPKEAATLRVRDLAAILRVSPGGLRRVARQPGFALPPRDPKLLAWTEEQVARFLAPPDVGALERRLRKEEADRLSLAAAKPPSVVTTKLPDSDP